MRRVAAVDISVSHNLPHRTGFHLGKVKGPPRTVEPTGKRPEIPGISTESHADYMQVKAGVDFGGESALLPKWRRERDRNPTFSS